MGRATALVSVVCLALLTAACSSDDDGGSDTSVVADLPGLDASEIASSILPAVEAVEDELGEGQEYFEVTANSAGFVNVFVAVDDATAAVPYLYFEGELQPPAPTQEGASGNTFTADDIDLDPDSLLARLADELPGTTVEAVSVYGDGFSTVYVAAGRSQNGGQLDIVVTGDGAIVSVDPI